MNNKYKLILFIAAVSITTTVFLVNRTKDLGMGNTLKNTVSRGGFGFDESTPGFETFQELDRGCLGKDCIPSIDDPKFESVTDADKWLDSGDIVFTLRGNNSVRGYPQAILNLHEIVNDQFESRPVAATFCPLCGSALAFERELDGTVLEFGVSGFLHNNDLVMYDRQTESLWQQITGEAIVGELKGKKLGKLPFSGLEWEDFKEQFPNAEVLSRDSGGRNYDYYPYGDYEESDRVSFSVEGGIDDTIHPKTVVYGVEIGDASNAYQKSDLEEMKIIQDTVGGKEITIQYDQGEVKVEDERGDEVTAIRLFWFAWKAFHPRTELYRG